MISLPEDRIFSTYKPGEKQKMESFDYTLCLPFVPEFSENLKRELQKQGIQVAFRKGQTLESLLCTLKFREPITKSKNQHLQKELQDLQLHLHWRDKPIPGMQRSRT